MVERLRPADDKEGMIPKRGPLREECGPNQARQAETRRRAVQGSQANLNLANPFARREAFQLPPAAGQNRGMSQKEEAGKSGDSF